MPILIAPLAPAILQIANFFFLCSSIFQDALIIRASLLVAFSCLWAFNIIPPLLLAGNHGEVPLDAGLWITIFIVLHARSVWALLRDECRRWPSPTPDDDALFAFFHRRTGMHRSDFALLRACGEWQRVEQGVMICDTAAARRGLFILVDGQAEARFVYEADLAVDGRPLGGRATLRSGDCFDLRLLNAIGVFLGFPNKEFTAVALSQSVLVFRIDLDALLALFRASPTAEHQMRTFALGILARLLQGSGAGAGAGAGAERRVGEEKKRDRSSSSSPCFSSFDAYGQPESEEWSAGLARAADFAPLQPAELASQRWTLRSMLRYLWLNMAWSVSPGARHAGNAASGTAAKLSVSRGAQIFGTSLRPKGLRWPKDKSSARKQEGNVERTRHRRSVAFSALVSPPGSGGGEAKLSGAVILPIRTTAKSR